MNCRPKCGTCLQHVVKLMHEHRENMQCDCQSERPPNGNQPRRPRAGSAAVRTDTESDMDMAPETV